LVKVQKRIVFRSRNFLKNYGLVLASGFPVLSKTVNLKSKLELCENEKEIAPKKIKRIKQTFFMFVIFSLR